MAPSDQVVSNAQKRKYNADAFHRNVQTVDTVVQDVSILQSFLIAKKAIEYNQPQELDVSSMSAQLDSVSSGKYYKVTEADGSTPKMAKLSEKARNSTDNMESEDVWSSNFSAQWNAMSFPLTGVLAMPSCCRQKSVDSNRSMNKENLRYALKDMRRNVSLDMRMHGKSNPCFKSTTSIHFGSVGWL